MLIGFLIAKLLDKAITKGTEGASWPTGTGAHRY
jgi:hypothetical protein